MRSFTRQSPALIVAVVALVAALAGTAIAGPSASTSAITKSKVKKISNKQIDKRFPVATADLADSSVTTAKLADLAVTAPKFGEVVVRKLEEPLVDGGNQNGNIACAAGEKIIGGGARITGPISDQGLTLQSSGPAILTGGGLPDDGSTLEAWRYAAHNAAGGSGDTTTAVYAVCLK